MLAVHSRSPLRVESTLRVNQLQEQLMCDGACLPAAVQQPAMLIEHARWQSVRSLPAGLLSQGFWQSMHAFQQSIAVVPAGSASAGRSGTTLVEVAPQAVTTSSAAETILAIMRSSQF